MMTTLQLVPGMSFDLRHVFLVLVPTYGGLPATLVTAGVALTYRFYEGGAGVTAGATGIVITSLMGLAYAHFQPHRNMSLSRLLALGACSNVALISVFVMPLATALEVLSRISAPFLTANFIGVMVAAQILNRHHSQVALERDLTKKAAVDALTGLANRHVFDEQGPALAQATAQAGKPCALMILDIDRFKQVNDTFGHVAGDEVIRNVAAVIAANLRPSDLVARYGGEEVAIVLPGQSSENARIIADRIRASVERASTTIRGIPLKVTISIGHATIDSANGGFVAALQAADEALYAAKAAGRNTVITAIAA
ncbi:diguanylate cyclase [Mesorhizobium sp. NBSH29]|nr:diguanylate cyclase [Mesorhizobium sp. NBSH29]